MILAWQKSIWESLTHRFQKNNLPHALLLYGQKGVGKKEFARAFSYFILCEKKEIHLEACHECHSCALFQANAHPDFIEVIPDTPGGSIKIDQIRMLVMAVNHTPQQGFYRVIVIDPAGAMNAAAANSLLKTLEEPSPRTLFLLLTEHPSHLPATIFSRCQSIYFPVPVQAEALSFLKEKMPDATEHEKALQLAEGAPLLAYQYLTEEFLLKRKTLYQDLFELIQQKQTPVALSERWKAEESFFILNLLWYFIKDVIHIRSGGDKKECMASDFSEEIAHVAMHCIEGSLISYIDDIQKIRGYLLNHIHLNKQLLLDDLFVKWTVLCQ